MPEIKYEPWKEIIIHELVIEPLERILKIAQLTTPMGGTARPLKWCKGWVMFIEGATHSPAVVTEQLSGRVHWIFVMISQYPEYTPAIDIQEGRIKVPLLDQTNNPTTEAFMDWFLKKFKKEIEAIADK